jgi:hypothetical protein
MVSLSVVIIGKSGTVVEMITSVVLIGISPIHTRWAVIKSLMSVTAPLMAYKPPLTATPLFRLIDVKANILPLKIVEAPSVAEEPTWKKTLHAWAPLVSTIDAADAVVSVDPIWNTKSEFGLFWPSSVSGPVICTADPEV